MKKIWLKNYQEGVPPVINPDQYPSIKELFEASCKTFSSRPAFVNMTRTLTFKELEEKSRAFAAYLQNIVKLGKGERIALMMPNLLQYPIALFGALRAGYVVVNINPLYTPRELRYQLQDSGCKVIVILANVANTLEKILQEVNIRHVIVTEVGDLLHFPNAWIVNWVVKYVKKWTPQWHIKNHLKFREVLRVGRRYEFKDPLLQGQDIAFLQYTGGTTGVPKGAMLTHRNMVANVEQAFCWIRPTITVEREVIITALPLYHIFSLLANCLTFLRAGALNVLVTNPRDMHGFIKILRHYPFTAITGVNTLFNALLNHPEFSRLSFKNLKIALGGGMSIQHSVAERWKKTTGIPLLEAYGLTEASPAVCINPCNLKNYNGSIGLPISSTDISIQDEQQGALGINQAGELWVCGPQVMKGYWNREEETKAVLQDNWLKTGDIAMMDEQGFIRIVERKKDMILVSGFNVYPSEVEDVIAMMAGVVEVAVVGVPCEVGERVKAFVVKKDPALTEDAILQHCRQALTAYKIPKEIEFRLELPKSNVGKILRRILREQNSGVKRE